jgi:hypothetical protein
METQDEIEKMFKTTYDLDSTMKVAIATAIPIWQFLKMTEDEYKVKYCNIIKPEEKK